ncbi:hypothetical protein M947_06470 [Sulfurimonas hongkongensis]|uniref:Replication-associated protein ORF2/G2P domain-containing protein n=1 Tax=Sulfurimonas hongkongensis TaxID=1172190 RepID=T0KRJ2_9BACT|nr:hypothetical protein [Sulfurimonas hongkongensis]EQB39634.1 hypothetical protein M947_06470 [Sulfurimonas hongkongensis]
MKNYGLSTYQTQKALDKLNFNKEFMQSNGIQLDNKLVPFADFVSNSYMNSDRYIAELQHRAWSIFDYAKERDLENIFFTLTLPSHWHEMKQKSKYDKTMIFNKNFGGRKYIKVITKKTKLKYSFINATVVQNIPYLEPTLDFTNTIDKFKPRNASKELSKMLKQLFNERSYRNISKDDRCYFRVTEPHKDGTPHIHISLFVPADKVESIVNSLTRLYPAPLGKIETNVKSSVSYLMKYILKTLDDLRDDNEKITNLTLWYLYHGISRFYTSRTFVSLEVYRKLNGMYTLTDLTKNYWNDNISIYRDTTTKKVVLIENEFGTIYTPKPVNWYDKLIDTDYTYLEADFEPIYKDKEVFKKPLEVVIDDDEYIIHHFALDNLKKEPLKNLNDIMIKKTKSPYHMQDYELYTYFENLDFEIVEPMHYAITRNLLINRGLLLDTPLLDLRELQDFKEF